MKSAVKSRDALIHTVNSLEIHISEYVVRLVNVAQTILPYLVIHVRPFGPLQYILHQSIVHICGKEGKGGIGKSTKSHNSRIAFRNPVCAILSKPRVIRR